MTDEFNKAKELLLNKTFTQKGGSGFQNYVNHVTFDKSRNEIRVSFKTINHDKDTIASMELSEFKGKHVI